MNAARVMLAVALSLLALVAQAQTLLNLKPLKGIWKPSDVASVEVRVRGRLTTDPATTHRIIGRVTLTQFDWVSALTLRTTLLVPATQTWEIKSLSVLVNTAAGTGLDSVEIITRPLATPHTAPAGKQLAIDVNSTTGVVMLGPVDMTPAPAPTPPVVTQAPAGAVISSLRVVRVDTSGTLLLPLTEGLVIDLATLPTRNISVEALVSSPAGIGRVEFRLDGAPLNTEGQSPYVACGDWNPCPQLTALGQHTLTVTPFDGAMKAGTPVSVRFTVK